MARIDLSRQIREVNQPSYENVLDPMLLGDENMSRNDYDDVRRASRYVLDVESFFSSESIPCYLLPSHQYKVSFGCLLRALGSLMWNVHFSHHCRCRPLSEKHICPYYIQYIPADVVDLLIHAVTVYACGNCFHLAFLRYSGIMYVYTATYPIPP